MKFRTKQFGLTIIEALAALAILAILITISLTVFRKVSDNAKEQLTEATVELFSAALEQYYEFWGMFPSDCNDCMDDSDFENETLTQIISGGIDNPDYYSISALYLALIKTPQSKGIVSKIADKLIVYENDAGDPIEIEAPAGGKEYNLFRVNDAWGNPLRYRFSDANDSFPLIESAGKDRNFAAIDDNISNRN